ncbi:MAG: hypothetical protein KF890_04315 [Nitrospira sp.]|nr:hypothetical protein [Nitrospira sp.]
MRMRQTCMYIIAGSVVLSQGFAYADLSGSLMASSGGTEGSDGAMKAQQHNPQGSSESTGKKSYTPPSGAKAGRDATLPDPTTNRKDGAMKKTEGIESYSPPSGAQVGSDATLPDPTTDRNAGIESYTPPSGAKAGRDATLPDPTTNREGSNSSSASGSGSGNMKSSGTGSSGGSGGGY